MKRVEAYHILGKMWDDATPEQREAIDIATNDIEFVDMMPDDMAAVVRCKDCKWWTQDGNGYCDDESHCSNPDGLDNYALPTDFCSYGKRRADNG